MVRSPVDGGPAGVAERLQLGLLVPLVDHRVAAVGWRYCPGRARRAARSPVAAVDGSWPLPLRGALVQPLARRPRSRLGSLRRREPVREADGGAAGLRLLEPVAWPEEAGPTAAPDGAAPPDGLLPGPGRAEPAGGARPVAVLALLGHEHHGVGDGSGQQQEDEQQQDPAEAARRTGRPPAGPACAGRADGAPAPCSGDATDQLAAAAHYRQPGRRRRAAAGTTCGTGLRLGRGAHERAQPAAQLLEVEPLGGVLTQQRLHDGRSGPHSSAKAGGSAHTICTSSAVYSSG